MAKIRSTSRPKRHVIGRRAFAAMAAVEGLQLSGESRKRLQRLRSSGLSAAERRAAILNAYRSQTRSR
jgi:hypothetical protein